VFPTNVDAGRLRAKAVVVSRGGAEKCRSGACGRVTGEEVMKSTLAAARVARPSISVQREILCRIMIILV